MCFVLNNNDVGSGIFISDLREKKIQKVLLLMKKKRQSFSIPALTQHNIQHHIKYIFSYSVKTHYMHPRDFCLPFDKISGFVKILAFSNEPRQAPPDKW